MKNETLNCAVIGCGAIGGAHIEGFQKHPRARVVAVADSSAERANETATKYKIERVFTDWEKLAADPAIDTVAVGLPNYLHAPVALAALRAGKHVMLEKPMSMTVAEGEEVVSTATKKKLTLMIGQQMRFAPDAQRLKAAIERGDLGDVYHARTTYIRRAGIPRIGSWFTQKKLAGGGALLDIGVHMLDLALHLMGSFEPVAVTGIKHARFGPRGQGEGKWGKSEIDPNRPFDVDDYAASFIKLRGGKSLILEVAWASHGDTREDTGVTLYGTEAGAMTSPARIVRMTNDGPSMSPIPQIPLPYPEEKMVHFVDCILNGQTPLVAPAQSLAVQKILNAIDESAQTGREIVIA